MTNIYQKLALATAGTALGLAAVGVHPAQAVVMYSVDLKNSSYELPPNPFISFKGLIAKVQSTMMSMLVLTESLAVVSGTDRECLR
ncbi:hypothetical protein [Coleofasciculus sp. E1-EBD-02]|jgi:hypothetical protein|uniref:hypothetical protein n=1 Tax=Coleofasciculus sp. E1-EBD-02 TaxID=3068481 RepID=UPI0032F1AF2A